MTSFDRHSPDFFVEYLHFNWPVVSCFFRRLTQAANFDHALAHHSAAHQQAIGWNQPVGYVKGEDAPARTRNLDIHLRIPPDMIYIDDNTDCSSVKLRGNLVGLLQSDY